MSSKRFTRTIALIAATLISGSFAQTTLAQGAFAQAPQDGGPGPIIDGPVDYPDYCKSPNKVILATPQVFTCAWSFVIPADVELEDLIIPYIATAEACAPNAYWNDGPRVTGHTVARGIYWLEVSCFHKGR